MVNAGNIANATRLRAIEGSALSLGVQVSSAATSDVAGIESAIETIARESNAGLIVVPGAPISDHRQMIFASAIRDRLPAVYPYRHYAADGGLMSYGSEPLDMWQRAASYVDRILKGEKPADLPVQAPTKSRTGHQSQNREGAWSRRAADATRALRRGDRIVWPDVNSLEFPGRVAMTRAASCQCRGFRVVVEAEPDTVAICHCQICQRRTGVPLTCNAFPEVEGSA